MTDPLKDIGALMLDLDGTLYLGSRLFPQTPGFLHTLDELGLKKLFLTNNSSRSTRQYLQKLIGLGIDAEEREILTSGWAAIRYLLNETPHRSVYLLGTPGLRQEFEEAGLSVVNRGEFSATDVEETVEREPDAVLLGFDMTLTYQRIRRAASYLLAGKPYFATHPDLVCPTESCPIPDTGSMIELFAASTGRRPLVIGKPQTPMIRAALDRLQLPASRVAMVGDRLMTDMRMAHDNGLVSVLVLSGEAKREDLHSLDRQPDLVVEHIGELAELLREDRQ